MHAAKDGQCGAEHSGMSKQLRKGEVSDEKQQYVQRHAGLNTAQVTISQGQ